MKSVIAFLIASLFSGAALAQNTTQPNISNTLTPCLANVPVVGNGAAAGPICWGTGALTSIAHVTPGTGVNTALAANANASGGFPTVPVANAQLANTSVTFGTTAVALGASSTSIAGLTSLGFTSGSTINWNSDTFVGRFAAANVRHGAADAASAVAQTLSVQGVVAGTSNTAGADFSIAGSQGTGTGNGGSILLKTARAGTTGTAQNALTTGFTLDGSTGLTSINAAPVSDSRLLVEDGTGLNQIKARYTGKTGFTINQLSNGNINFGLADAANMLIFTNNGSTSLLEIFASGGAALATSPIDYGANNLYVQGAIGCAAPITKTGTSGTVGNSDCSVIFNASGTYTATLPTASSYSGRLLYVKNIAAQTVNSASSNVVPLAGGAAGTVLLASTAGKWATLQSDGTNWIVMAGN